MDRTKNCFTADPILYGILKQYAQHHRNNPTEAERCLWQWLKGGLYGKKFRRQHIVADYIADFICISSKLIIELDGGYHFVESQQQSDAMRTERLERLGYKVIRFRNEEVIASPTTVINTIRENL